MKSKAGRPPAVDTWIVAAVAKELVSRGYTTKVGLACVAAIESHCYMCDVEPRTVQTQDIERVRRAYQKMSKADDGYQIQSDGSKFKVCLVPEQFINDARRRLEGDSAGGDRAILDGRVFCGMVVRLTEPQHH